MAYDMTAFQQTIVNLTTTLQAKTEEVSELQRLDRHRKDELDLKDAELAVYYRHMANLQQRLDRTNESLAVAEGQLEAANELKKESLRCIEEYKTRFMALKRQLDELTEINKMQERHLILMQRQVAEHPRGTWYQFHFK